MSGDDHGHVTLRQLRMVACFEAALREVMGITLLHNGERRSDGRFRFGDEEAVAGTPYLELTHIDRMRGDAWSGDIRDWDTLALHNVRHPDGRPLQLEVQSQDNSLAGRCDDVYSSLPDDRRDAFASAYFRHWRAELAPSPDFFWMLSADERATLR